ncbi:MAG: hypothetical protein V3T49_01535, partial [Dehalococcoidia bacterium]
MKVLTSDAFEKASEFIAKTARPLERAQFDLHFGSGSIDAVLDELQKFQNDDGGFGHAVEPDVRMPHSSPFISSVAFQVIRELSVPAEHQIVRDGIGYFEHSYDRTIGGWEPIGPQSANYPHARWWEYKPVVGQLDPLI